ncbi:MAG: NAD(P)/FAD-dependent oxidoreductase [bacterium]|nr:NAD(P)/FAD-dependent oxidoreductase [bacterium]
MKTQSVAIIGGGVVGLAIAHTYAQAGHEVFLFEKSLHFGDGQSGRSSGVAHPGIYYPTGSLKAILCVRGRQLQEEFCLSHGVPFIKPGKLIVARTHDEVPALEFYRERGTANGVRGLRIITREELKEYEPNIEGVAALHSPQTAIVDAGAFVQKLAELSERAGAHLFRGREIVAIEKRDSQFVLSILNHDNTKDKCSVDRVFNAAGLYADEIARMVNPESLYRIIPVRGEYCRYASAKKSELRIHHAIYGLPQEIEYEGRKVFSSGMHLLPTIGSDTILVGPTARVVEKKDDYEGNRFGKDYFLAYAQSFKPTLREEDLEFEYAGIRAELLGHNDFMIEEDPRNPGFRNLLGIRSPGLTAALAIAEYI